MTVLKNPYFFIVEYLKISFIRNKFEATEEIIKDYNLILVSKLNLDSSSSVSQFKVNSYKNLRRDYHKVSRELILYVNETTT